MAKYAFRDANRKNVVYATSAMREDRDKIFFCPNPACTAQLCICAIDGSRDAYFRATKPGFPHIPGCSFGSKETDFDKNKFSEEEFVFDNAIDSLCVVTDKRGKSCVSSGHNTGKVKKHPPRTLRQIYSLCKSYPITDTYNDKKLGEMILDDRSIKWYPKGCFGYKIIEAIVKGKIYDDIKRQIYLKAPITSKKYSIVLQFEDDILYKDIRTEIYNNSNKIIVIAGKWEKSASYNYFQTKMYGRKQLTVIKTN